MNFLAIIPARGGSKRIPRKNIRPFAGQPIINYSIEVAKELSLFDEIMVSTEDGEIAELAREAGAVVPFLRSRKNADDFSTITDVVKEVLETYRRHAIHFDVVCCILPTAPFITPRRLMEGFEKLQASNFDAVIPVQRFQYPIQRALQVDGITGRVSMVHPENLRVRSQDLPYRYHDCGQFYWARVASFEKEGTFFAPNAGYIELSAWEVQDIDEEEDWILAEHKFETLRHIKGI